MSGDNKTYEELRAELGAQLESCLADLSEKHPPNISEIRTRMDALRQQYINNDDRVMYQPPEGVLLDIENRFQVVSPEKWLEHSYRIFLKKLRIIQKCLLIYIIQM